ncbi:hypothetical protein M4R22_02910 [Acidovorax sp. GBBC 3334]|uniref:hypothetical protein n=1 Tax=unclassified Acidovorax TaxID=2684926 RepID=UPI002302D628|nr:MULTISPECIES: hypothetical protein [unclassified Acidovorax]MDA8453706.1 hypothetical protein [Acidovorax sp. GBBC 3334]MDA8522286.1 hypothetical protein [Acidovorax sp. NCPPB 4044]
MAATPATRLLAEGLADAAGFVLGALAGFGLARWLGFDVFAPGYGAASLIGIALTGLGGGLGLQLARRALRRRRAPAE